MTLFPIPPLSLNITTMDINDMVISKIKLKEHDFDLPLKPLYIIFVCMFAFMIIQTIILSVVSYKILYIKKKAYLNLGPDM